MKSLLSVCGALALAGLPAAASAQVTQSYQYDANGRLTGVTTAGSAGTNTAAYVYDDADNRTSRSQTGTTAYATLSPRGAPSGPEQAQTLDTLSLAFAGHGDVALGGSIEMGPHTCIGTELSLSRWAQARAGLVSGEPSSTVVWRSHTSTAANAGFLNGGDEHATSTQDLSRWSVSIGGERCSS